MERKTKTNHQKVFEYRKILYYIVGAYKCLYSVIFPTSHFYYFYYVFIFHICCLRTHCIRFESINNASVIVNIYRQTEYFTCLWADVYTVRTRSLHFTILVLLPTHEHTELHMNNRRNLKRTV